MNEYSVITTIFGLPMLIFTVTFVNNVLYIFRLGRLLVLLKQRWPEKWMELGEPRIFTFFLHGQSFQRNTWVVLNFVRNPGVAEDATIAKLIKQIKSHLRVGLIGMILLIIAILICVPLGIINMMR